LRGLCRHLSECVGDSRRANSGRMGRLRRFRDPKSGPCSQSETASSEPTHPSWCGPSSLPTPRLSFMSRA
jgi:hypothetical protein